MKKYIKLFLAIFTLMFIGFNCSVKKQQVHKIEVKPTNGQELEYGNQKKFSTCIDENFKDEELTEIYAAIQEWQDALSGVICFDLKEFTTDSLINDAKTCRLMILRASSDFPWVELENSKTRAATHELCGNYIWLLIDRIKPGELKTIVVHEIGHAFCLKHTPTGVMKNPLNNGALIEIDDAVWAAYFLGTM